MTPFYRYEYEGLIDRTRKLLLSCSGRPFSSEFGGTSFILNLDYSTKVHGVT